MRVRFPITNYLITINPDHVIAYLRLLDVARLAADNGDPTRVSQFVCATTVYTFARMYT